MTRVPVNFGCCQDLNGKERANLSLRVFVHAPLSVKVSGFSLENSGLKFSELTQNSGGGTNG
jgi:hypothetical protein